MLKFMHLWIVSAAAAGVLIFTASAAGAAPVGASGTALNTSRLLPGTMAAGYRRYREWDYDDDDGEYYEVPGDYYDGYYEAPVEYYPPRVYRYAPPPAAYYEPPVYGWLSPPRPMSCGKYRYWNGDHCADARRHPPYVGPRW